jgi:hypothetical protein
MGICNAVSTTTVHWLGVEEGCSAHHSSFFIFIFNIFRLSAPVTSKKPPLSGFQVQFCVNSPSVPSELPAPSV